LEALALGYRVTYDRPYDRPAAIRSPLAYGGEDVMRKYAGLSSMLPSASM
jgi:hypothetical protein